MTLDAPAVRLTMLSSMAAPDFKPALDRHVAWDIHDLDLKDGIYGKGVADLSPSETARAAREIAARGLSVWCLSSTLFSGDVDAGESAFRAAALEPLNRLLDVAEILRPRALRLIAAQCRAAGFGARVAWVDRHAPWLWDAYREGIDRVAAAGFDAVIENESECCLIDSPDSAAAFFERVDRPGPAKFTWDVQNMWQAGTFPTLAVYERLSPLIGYYHVKGGRSDGALGDGGRGDISGGPPVWQSSLADASWPVEAITARVVADRVSPVICLNSPHGASAGDEHVDYTEADLRYLQALIR